MEKIKGYFKKLFINIFITRLSKHPFKEADLIKVRGSRILYEVEHLYYDQNFDWILIIREYGKSKILSIDKYTAVEFIEYKGVPPEELV
jgi:hypothetical protein